MLPLRPARPDVHNPSIKLVLKRGKSLQIFFNYLSDSFKMFGKPIRPGGKQELKLKPGTGPALHSRKRPRMARYLKKRERQVLQEGAQFLLELQILSPFLQRSAQIIATAANSQ